MTECHLFLTSSAFWFSGTTKILQIVASFIYVYVFTAYTQFLIELFLMIVLIPNPVNSVTLFSCPLFCVFPGTVSHLMVLGHLWHNKK